MGGDSTSGGCAHGDWADTLAELFWLDFGILATVLIIGFLFEKGMHAISHKIEKYNFKSKTVDHLHPNFWNILFNAFKSEITTLGFTAWTLWVFNKIVGWDRLVGDEEEGMSGPTDGSQLLHHIEMIHMVLFLSMASHLVFVCHFIYVCRTVHALVSKYLIQFPKLKTKTDEELKKSEFRQLHRMEKHLLEWLNEHRGDSEQGNATNYHFPAYLLSKITYSIKELVSYSSATWISVSILYIGLSGICRYTDIGDRAGDMRLGIFFGTFGFTFVMLIGTYVMFRILYIGNPAGKKKCWMSTCWEKVTDDRCIYFLQFILFYMNFEVCYGLVNSQSPLEIISTLICWVLSLVLGPPVLGHYFIFLMSLPPFFDDGDFQQLVTATEEQAKNSRQAKANFKSAITRVSRIARDPSSNFHGKLMSMTGGTPLVTSPGADKAKPTQRESGLTLRPRATTSRPHPVQSSTVPGVVSIDGPTDGSTTPTTERILS
jgi:hypothetical protein